MYRTDKQFMKDPSTASSRVYVGNLPETVISNDLEEVFGVHGKILGLTLQRGFAFIQFENPSQANVAINSEHGKTFHGKRLNVKQARGGGNQNQPPNPVSTPAPPAPVSKPSGTAKPLMSINTQMPSKPAITKVSDRTSPPASNNPAPNNPAPNVSPVTSKPQPLMEPSGAKTSPTKAKTLPSLMSKTPIIDLVDPPNSCDDTEREWDLPRPRNSSSDGPPPEKRRRGDQRNGPPPRDIREHDNIRGNRDNIRDNRDNSRDNRDNSRDTRDNIRDNRDNNRDNIRDNRDNIRDNRENIRDNRDNIRDNRDRGEHDRDRHGPFGRDNYSYRERDVPPFYPRDDAYGPGFVPPPIIERPERNDCEIIVVSKGLTQYAEYIENRLKTLGLVVDLLFPNEDVPIGRVLANISSRGCLYAILVMPQNEEHRSLTLNILHGIPQEHRNMPTEDALILITRNFDSYMRGVPIAPTSTTSLTERHPESVQLLFNLLAENRHLTTVQYDRLLKYLQERRELQGQFEVAEGIEAGVELEPGSKQAELQSRIMSILNKPADSPKPVAPPVPAPGAPTPLLNDPSVQKALDSLLSGDMFKSIAAGI